MISIYKKLFKRQIRFLLLIVVMFLLGLTEFLNNSSFALPAILIFFYLILSGSVIDDFYSYVGMIPFFDLFRIGSISIGFFFLLISAFKILDKTRFRNTPSVFFCVVILLLLEFFGDFFYVSSGLFLVSISPLLYFGCFISFVSLSEYNHKYSSVIFIFSLIIAQIFIIGVAGGLTSFINEVGVYRLGEYRSDGSDIVGLGGAMGFPIYTILICSFLFRYLLERIEANRYTLLVCLIVIIELIVTFFTLSRVYLLGLIVLFPLLLLHLVKNNLKSTVLFLLTIFLIVVFILYQNAELVDNILFGYLQRGEDDVSTGRFDIYLSSLEYLLKNPIALFLGEGLKNYREIGLSLNKAFGISAHNLYIDALLSFGLLGTLCLFTLCIYFLKKVKKHSIKKASSILSVLPLFAYCTMVNTGGSFIDFKTYIYILFLSMNVYNQLKNSFINEKNFSYRSSI